MDLGVIVDLETTGINPSLDKIIELGLIVFRAESGVEPAIVRMYSGLEDPKQPLAPEVTKITGLRDADLAGQTLDWAFIRRTLAEAAIVIAHNAAFDSEFLRLRPELEGLSLSWACSMKHIDWEQKGFKTRSLNYLACDHGFINPFPHRALFDCATTFRLLAPHLSELASRCYLKDYRVLAVGAPFEKKDLLKKMRYFWDGEQRVWYKDVLEDRLAQERSFLAAEIYQPGADRHQEMLLSASL